MKATNLAPKQTGLNLIMNVREPRAEHIKAIKDVLLTKEGQAATVEGLNRVGTVHFLKFILFNNDTQFATLTEFDGDYESYVRDFTNILHPILNPFFAHVEGSDEMLPIQKNPEKFLQFLQKYNVPSFLYYSAYPEQTALEIREKFGVDSEAVSE